MGKIFGYAMITFGIILLLIAFLLGYGLYQSLNGEAFGPMQAQGGQSINSTLSSFTNNLTTVIKETSYIFLQIIVLFLFASIGYKFAYLGIKSVEGGGKEEKDRKESD